MDVVPQVLSFDVLQYEDRRVREQATLMAQQIGDAYAFSDEEIDLIEKEGYAAIESARLFAEASAEPSVDTIEEGVYAP